MSHRTFFLKRENFYRHAIGWTPAFACHLRMTLSVVGLTVSQDY